MKHLGLIFTTLCLLVPFSNGQDKKNEEGMQNCPMHQDAASHHALVEKHGDQAMGFAHATTTHHFRMTSEGGAIEVTANDPADKTNTNAIRMHLTNIARLFESGDFSIPMFVHDGVPPGVTAMKLLKAAIRYKYEEIPAGARVRVLSSDPVAQAAIHDFLRFQITDHQTGDDLTVNQ